MADANSRYVVRVNLDITNLDGTPFNDANHTWSGVGYADMVAIQDVLMNGLNTLLDMGKQRAGDMSGAKRK